MTVLQLDVEGPAAPPRSNGELVFAAPWESRAFGLALALHDGGLFEWEAFRQQLMAAVARAEAALGLVADPGDTPGPPGGGEFSYYRCWLEALQTLLDTTGLVDSASVDELAAVLAGRPAGHDHDHGNHDHHDH